MHVIVFCIMTSFSMKNAAVLTVLGLDLGRRCFLSTFFLSFDCSYPQVIPEDIEKNLLQEIPQPRIVPRRLDEYTPEEIAAFPRVWTP